MFPSHRREAKDGGWALFSGHVLDQIYHTVAVSKLVVIPGSGQTKEKQNEDNKGTNTIRT